MGGWSLSEALLPQPPISFYHVCFAKFLGNAKGKIIGGADLVDIS